MRWSSKVGRSLAAFLVVAGVLAAAALPRPAHAHDTGAPHVHGADLPPPPEGYREELQGSVLWVFPEQARAAVNELQAAQAEAWSEVARQLGGNIDDAMVIRVGRNPEEMRALAPVGHPPPSYATGVAYPFGLILLTLTAPETWERPAVEKVLTHELSHVALRRAVEGRSLPRWFVEGLAIHHADENSLERIRQLWQATIQGRLIPIDELDRGFPHHPREVGTAYAQAASLVTFLLDDEEDGQRFAALIDGLRRGERFEAALYDAYDLTLEGLEHEWLASVRNRFRTWPLILGGSTLWVLISLLVFVAYGRRKQRAKAKLQKWADEEAELDRVEDVAHRRLAELEEEGRVVVHTPDEQVRRREPEVPTVHHEGRNHTLH